MEPHTPGAGLTLVSSWPPLVAAGRTSRLLPCPKMLRGQSPENAPPPYAPPHSPGVQLKKEKRDVHLHCWSNGGGIRKGGGIRTQLSLRRRNTECRLRLLHKERTYFPCEAGILRPDIPLLLLNIAAL